MEQYDLSEDDADAILSDLLGSCMGFKFSI